MEAKDTIVKSSPGTVHYPTREESAEISFKAGFKYALEGAVMKGGYESVKKAGIREVVEFVEGNIPKILSNYVGFWQSWQAKLEEWGL